MPEAWQQQHSKEKYEVLNRNEKTTGKKSNFKESRCEKGEEEERVGDDGVATAPAPEHGCHAVLRCLFRRYSSLLLLSSSPFPRLLVLSATVALAAASAVGFALLKQEFDPLLFLPTDSYLALFVSARKRC